MKIILRSGLMTVSTTVSRGKQDPDAQRVELVRACVMEPNELAAKKQ